MFARVPCGERPTTPVLTYPEKAEPLGEERVSDRPGSTATTLNTKTHEDDVMPVGRVEAQDRTSQPTLTTKEDFAGEKSESFAGSSYDGGGGQGMVAGQGQKVKVQ